MRCLLKSLVTILSALLLLLFLASLVLWLRSYHLTDQLTWQNAGGWRQIRTAQGHFVLGFLLADWSDLPAATQPTRYERDEVRPPVNYFIYASPDPGDTWVSWQHAGFAYYHRRNVAKRPFAIAVAPCWSIALATALLPLATITARLRRRLRRRRMQQNGLCENCGYDLRATPKGTACPECGRIN